MVNIKPEEYQPDKQKKGRLLIETDPGEKGAWVRAAKNSKHGKLANWVRAHLNRIAAEEAARE